MQWLRTLDWKGLAEDGEAPREAVYLPGWRPQWLLVTNRRLLLFAASRRGQRLLAHWPRRAVLFAGAPEQLAESSPRALWARLWTLPPNLALQLDDGTQLALRSASTVTARRAAQLLLMGATVSTWAREPGTTPRTRRRWHEVVAAFLLPGAGQCLQGRFATGALLLAGAMLLFFLQWGPLLRTQGLRLEAPSAQQASALLNWVLLSLLAATDAFQFSAARRV
jgi:hypothetical protein